jgi:TrmH family RNA methyltransferase
MLTPLPFQKTEFISSEQNPKFKIWRSLLQPKGRKKEGLFILSGEKIIAEFLANPKMSAKFRINAALFPNNEELYNNSVDLVALILKQVQNSSFESDKNQTAFNLKNLFFRLETYLLKELDIIGTHSFLLVLELKSFAEQTLNMEPIGLELVCPIGDPNNLGSLCRSAVAFGVKKIILTKNSSDPYNPKALKSSSGAVLNIEFTKLEKDISEIQASDLSPADIGLDLDGKNISQFRWPKNCRLWLGEEGPGLKVIPKEQCLIIPIEGIESLNVTVAGSIALYAHKTQLT